jgi:hypothetical protein
MFVRSAGRGGGGPLGRAVGKADILGVVVRRADMLGVVVRDSVLVEFAEGAARFVRVYV